MSSSSFLIQNVISSPKSDLPYLNGRFTNPSGLAVDSEGSVIFVDSMAGKILKLNTATGEIITIAGSGAVGLKDGKALSASFNYPQGIAVGSENVIYVSDNYNKAIRKISRDNFVSTLISGDKVGSVRDITFYDARQIIYFVSETFIGTIKNDASGYKIWAGSSQSGYQDGKAGDARFEQAFGISINQATGDLYVTDYNQGALRKIDQNQVVTTIQKGFLGPWGLHVIRNESVIIAEYYGSRINRYSFETQKAAVIAGTGSPGLFDGAGKDANLCIPFYITWNPFNEEIIFSEWDLGIRVVNKFNYVSTYIMPFGYGQEPGPAHKARISSLVHIAIDENEEILYFSDFYNNSLRKASLLNGTVSIMAGKPYSGNVNGNLSDALFSSPWGIAYTHDTLLMADFRNNMIKKVTLSNSTISDFMAFQAPTQIAIDQSKASFYLSKNMLAAPVSKFDINGNFIHDLGSGKAGCVDGYYDKASFFSVNNVYGMADGAAYFTDYWCNTIRFFDPKTLLISVLAGKSQVTGYADGIGTKVIFNGVYGLDYYVPGRVFYVCDTYNNLIRQVTLDGNVTTVTGSIEGGYRNGPISIALFQSQTQLKVLSNGDLVVCDEGNHAMRLIKRKDGMVVTLFGYGAQKYFRDPGNNLDLNYPISVTSKQTRIFVLNREDNNILGYDLIKKDRFLLAGNGAIGWNDGDPLDAMFNRPEEIHYSAEIDCIYVADTQNHLIRKVSMQGLVTTFAGSGKKGSRNDVLLASEFNLPSSVTTDSNGDIFVADSGNNAIRKIGDGRVSFYAGNSGISDLVNGKLFFAKFNFPTGIAYDRMSGCLVVADMYNHAIRLINATHVSTLTGNGTLGYMDGPLKQALFAYPRKIAIDEIGLVFVTDSYNGLIRKISSETVSTISKLQNPLGLHVSNGQLYVSEHSNNLIKSLFVGKTSTPLSVSINSDSINTAAISAAVLVLGFAAIAIWTIIKRSKLKTMKVTEKLNQIQSPSAGKEQTGTVTLSQTRAFAIPGYLELDLKKSVKLSENGGMGGTAKVILGTLTNPSLVAKHSFLEVAIKFPNNDTTQEEDFYYEITVMSSFPKSDNIVEFVGFSSKPLAIVMKSYPASLSDVIDRGAYANDNPIKVKFAIDIAKGMEIIHKCGVIHFDLKPANILLHNVNGSMTAAICDFGFANFSSDAQANLVKGVKAPRTNGITARYAAPEQFQRGYSINRLDANIYQKVDVYAYAMTIYFVFTRTKPWKNEDSVDQIEKLVCSGKRPEFPDNLTPTDIHNLVILCWSQEAMARPSFTDIVTKLILLQG